MPQNLEAFPGNETETSADSYMDNDIESNFDSLLERHFSFSTEERHSSELNSQNESTTKDLKNKIRNSAIALLARREHSKHELKTKLVKKFGNDSQISDYTSLLLHDLKEQGLQSDERFVESFIRFKRSQGKGPAFVKSELRQRGVSEYLIASYIYDQDEDWTDLAQSVYEKKFGTSPPIDTKEKAKRIRFMVSRGFTPDCVFDILKTETI